MKFYLSAASSSHDPLPIVHGFGYDHMNFLSTAYALLNHQRCPQRPCLVFAQEEFAMTARVPQIQNLLRSSFHSQLILAFLYIKDFSEKIYREIMSCEFNKNEFIFIYLF